MAVSLNSAGRAHLNSLIASGKIDNGAEWNLTSQERDDLDTNMFLGGDSEFDVGDQSHWKYPFGKNGKVYRSALRAIASRASAQNETEISNAASAAIEKIDSKQKNSDNPDSGTLTGVEIFKIGTWAGSRKITVTGAMLDQIAANFANLNSKVTGFGVPVKLGHNDAVGAPAYGWVSKVYRQGDTLLADFESVPSEIVDAIGKRLYNSVSIELAPIVRYAGKVFQNVLAGIALLGAEWPAVKGLKPLSASLFSADADEVLVLSQEKPVLKFTQEEADALVLAAETKAKAEFQAKLDAAEAAKTKAEGEAATAKAALAAIKAESDTKAFSDLVEQAIKDGKVLPKSKDAYLAIAANFAAKSEKVKFGDKELAPVDMFKSFLDGLPKIVSYTEAGRAKSEKPGSGEKASETLDTKARALLSADTSGKLDYEGAVAKVLASDADLKAAYIEENA